MISRFKISNCTADGNLLLLSLNKRNRNLHYNHKAKIVYNNDKKSNKTNLSKFRVLSLIYIAFLLENDVPDIGLDQFELSF